MRRLTDNHPVLPVLLLLLCALLPLMLWREFTPSNELRYLNIVDEALQSGKLFAFTCHGVPYADKPPFFFWLMMLCRIVAGSHSMICYSLLTFIPACVVICVVDRWCTSAFGLSPRERTALALMLATAGMFTGMTVVIRMDMMMCMWIVLALYTFWKMETGGTRGNKAYQRLLPLFIFMGLFTKGPVGLLMPVVSIASYLVCTSRGSEIGRYLGFRTWGVLAVLCALWFFGAWADGGSAYLQNLLFHQTIDRAVNAFHHKEPFWYYCKVIWVILVPWCLACVSAFVVGFKGHEFRRPTGMEEKTFVFFMVTLSATFLMLSLFSSKLPVYAGPLIPFFIAILPVTWRRYGETVWFRLTAAVPAVLLSVGGFLMMTVAAVGLTTGELPMNLDFDFLASPLVLAGGLVLFSGGIVASVCVFRRESQWERVPMILALALLFTVLIASYEINAINAYVV